ncbi:MAG: hypothetical protein J7L37_05945 [Thermococcus sp.]|nr:hypothetical protein [Thermococcus sp.]
MKRRGFIFTLDALLAVILVLIMVTSIVSIQSQSLNVYTSSQRIEEKYLAEDTLNVLRTTPLVQVVPPAVIAEWESTNASIIEKWVNDSKDVPVLDPRFVDPYMTPVEIMSTYWALEPKFPGLRRRAMVIMKYVLDRLLKGYSYEMIISANGTGPYNYSRPFVSKILSNNTAITNVSEVSPATLVISGYAYNQTPKGYIARAYLSKLRAKVTSYVYFGSSAFAYAPDETDYTVVKMVIPNEQENPLPYDANIIKVKWFPQPRWFSPGSYMQLFIDGEPVKCGQFEPNTFVLYTQWEVLEDSNPSDPNTCNMLEILRRHSNLRRHVFEIRVYNPGGSWSYGSYYVGGTHPNSFVGLEYKTSQMNTFNYPHVFHFDEITTNHPFQVENAVFIAGNLSNMSVTVKIDGADLIGELPQLYLTYLDKRVDIGYGDPRGNDTFIWSWEVITSKLATAGIDWQSLSKSYVWFAVTFGMPYNNGERVSVTPGRDFGRNVTLDYAGSYIFVDYTPSVASSSYSIDITREINQDNVVGSRYAETLYGTNFYTMLEWRYNVPTVAVPLWTKLHIVRLHHVRSYEDNAQKFEISPGFSNWHVLYCHGAGCSPDRPFADPAFTRWGVVRGVPDNAGNPIDEPITPGDNYIRVETGTDYVISKEFTTGEVTYLLDAYASYDKVFPMLMQGYDRGIRAYNLTYQGAQGESSIVVGDFAAVSKGYYTNITACELDPENYAVDDAILRLFEKLGGDGCNEPLLVNLEETKIDFATVEGVPTSIGPIIITLRVWREN